jgi:hypothetical protein
MKTNAKDQKLAGILAESRPGTFTGIVVRKVGETRGGVLYGDDLVRVTVRTGISYKNLVEKSLKVLNSLSATSICREAIRLGLRDVKTGKTVSIGDVYTAKQELQESFKKVVNDGKGTDEEKLTNFEPLEVNGEKITGVRVYTNPDSDNHGSVYLMGLKMSETVLDWSPNGAIPAPKSAAKTLAKNLIKSKLPIGKFVRYRLNGNFILRTGGKSLTRVTKTQTMTDKQQDEVAVQLF